MSNRERAMQLLEYVPDYKIEYVIAKLFGDGEHILYVNGEYRWDSEIGKPMHDFNCVDADDMYFYLTAERTKYLKDNSGVKKMSSII